MRRQTTRNLPTLKRGQLIRRKRLLLAALNLWILRNGSKTAVVLLFAITAGYSTPARADENAAGPIFDKFQEHIERLLPYSNRVNGTDRGIHDDLFMQCALTIEMARALYVMVELRPARQNYGVLQNYLATSSDLLKIGIKKVDLDVTYTTLPALREEGRTIAADMRALQRFLDRLSAFQPPPAREEQPAPRF